MYYDIMASQRNGTLYLGVSNNISIRVHEHKTKLHPQSFTSKYNVSILVYYEEFSSILEAIHREKCLKRWKRMWKLELIGKEYPMWRDFYENFIYGLE